MKAKGEVILPASGLSMYPYILPRDECRFVPFDGRMDPGQIALFVSEEGVLISHRLHLAEPRNKEERYWLRGDGNFSGDRPVGRAQMIGILVEVTRNGRKISEKRFDRRWWGRLAVRYPRLLKLSAHASRWRAKRESAFTDEGGGQDGVSNRFPESPARGAASGNP